MCLAPLVSRLLVQDRFIKPLLLLLQLLDHVVINLTLLLVKNRQTVLKRHLALKLVMLPKELGVLALAPQLKRRNIYALKTLLQTLERLGQRKQHENALERLEQVLCVLVLPCQLNAQMDEAGRLNQLDQTAQRNELRCVHFKLGEARDEPVGQLVVAREQAQG